MFYPATSGNWDTRSLRVVPTEHVFTTPDHVRLHAWWFHAANANAPVIVWFHGNAGNITDRAENAMELATRGVSVFVFDYRGFGKSEGAPSESKLLLDALAAFDFVRANTSAPLVLYGESIGGPYAAYVAKERKNIRAVILENTFPSLMDLGNALYGLGWTAPFALRTTDWLNEAGAPVLVMHGTRDAVIPYRLGKKLFDGLRVRKEMLTSETAGHCEIPHAEPSRYYETVIRFATTGGPAG
jgi:alpha-beta hydrolase superfamily lysophospholipase